MTGSSIAALPRLVDATPDATAVHLELESLRLLLLRVAEALCSGDASQVQQLSTDLDRCAVNLRPAFGKLLLDGKDLSLVECEQQRRRILQPLLEARSYYRAALRRWRRSLVLRRSLTEMRRDVPEDQEAELSRWC